MIYADTGNLEELYKPVLEMFLQGDTDYLAALRRQLETVRVTSVEEDGYGIFVNLEVDPATRILNPELQENMLSGVSGRSLDGEHVCAFALFVSDGALSLIDGFPLGPDTWPKERVLLRAGNRDMVTGNGYVSGSWGTVKLSRLTFGKAIITGSSLEADRPTADAEDVPALMDAAMGMLLAGEQPYLPFLREQFEQALIRKREAFSDEHRVYYRIDDALRIPEGLRRPDRIAGVVGIAEGGKIVVWFRLAIVDGKLGGFSANSLLMDRWPEGKVSLWYLNRDEHGHEYVSATRPDPCEQLPLPDDLG